MQHFILYSIFMYASEKYVRMEVKELRQQISEVATDLGGDIRYLDQEISNLRAVIQILQQQIIDLSEAKDDS